MSLRRISFRRIRRGCVAPEGELFARVPGPERPGLALTNALWLKLWQGAPSGANPKCKSPFGVYDMVGNVDESRSPARAQGAWLFSKAAIGDRCARAVDRRRGRTAAGAHGRGERNC